MKNSITLTALLALTLFAGTAIAGNTDSPLIDKKQENQQNRIEQGINSGSLTFKEAVMLNKQQSRIANREECFKSDGTLTKRERVRINHDLNRASKNIAIQKHDRQHRR